MPAVVEASVLIVPDCPAFSPVAIAELLSVNRCTVHYWLEKGKLVGFRDNADDRHVMRDELIRFATEYLKLNVKGVLFTPVKTTPLTAEKKDRIKNV